jgi:hypothetical protein
VNRIRCFNSSHKQRESNADATSIFEYFIAIPKSEKQMSKKRKRKPSAMRKNRKEQKEKGNKHWHPYTDAFTAFLAEDYAAVHDLEMREQFGDDWANPSFSSDSDGLFVGEVALFYEEYDCDAESTT